MDLDVKCKTMKLWKRNSHRRKPSGSRVRNAKRVPKACATHRKTDKSDLIKIKTFHSVKKRIQIQITDGKISAKHTSNRGRVSTV